MVIHMLLEHRFCNKGAIEHVESRINQIRRSKINITLTPKNVLNSFMLLFT